MNTKEWLLKEKVWLTGEVLVWSFIALAFNESLGFLYGGGLVLADFMISVAFGNKLSVFDNSQIKNTPIAITKAFLAYFGFLIITFVVSLLLTGITTFGNSTQAVFNIFSTTTLPLESNPIMIMFVFAVLIARRETRVWIRVAEVSAILLKIPFSLKIGKKLNWSLIGLILAPLSAAFMFYHIRTRNIQDQSAWLITFLFMMFTYVLLFIVSKGEKKEMEAPVYLHMINNGLAVANKLQGFWLFTPLNAFGKLLVGI